MMKRSKKDAVGLSSFWGYSSLVGIACLLSSCILDAPELDLSDELGRAGIINAANIALTHGDCGRAIHLMDPLYNSVFSDNEIRTVFASAHGCNTQIQFFNFISDLIDNAANLAGAAFWTTITELFDPASGTNAVTLESRMQSAMTAAEALMATRDPGMVLPETHLINTGTNNEGSLYAFARVSEANFFMILITMAMIGHSHHIYGNPSADNEQQTALPWLLSTDLVGTTFDETAGCAYAGAVVHLVDSIDETSAELNGSNIANSLSGISTLLRDGVGGLPGLSDACSYGCQGLLLDGATPAGTDAAACTFTAAECNPCSPTDPDCVQCPVALRNPTSCQNDNFSRCAAAGVVRLMDAAWTDE